MKSTSVYQNPADDVVGLLPVEKRKLTRHASDVAVDNAQEVVHARRRQTTGFSGVE